MNPKDIAALQPGQILRDTVVPGLHVWAKASGTSYFLYFRTKDGRERRPKLGDVRVLTTAQAREAAKVMLAKATLGRDPTADRVPARSNLTVAGLMGKYLRQRGGKTDKEARRAIDKDVIPKLGRRAAVEVTHEECEALHAELTLRGPTMANRVLDYVNAAYNAGLKRRWLPDGALNPCSGIRWNREVTRKRHLWEGEFPKLKAILDRDVARFPRAVAFTWLMLYSGARPSEIVTARWSQLTYRCTPSGDVGILTLPDGKMGSREVILPPQAMAVLAKLPRTTGPICGLKKHPKHNWQKWRKEMRADDLWLRDLRRSFATVALSNGEAIGVIGEVLGHADAQTTKIYARLMDDAAERAVIQTASAIDRLMAPVANPRQVAPVAEVSQHPSEVEQASPVLATSPLP